MPEQITLVPEADPEALIDEAHRLVEAFTDEADGTAPTIVAVAFDDIGDREALVESTVDEVVEIERTDGTFSRGAAGVRARAEALAEIERESGPILLPDTADGTDLAAATARRLRRGCVTDCLLRVRDGELLAGRPVYGGRAYAEISFDRGPPVVTLNTEALGTPSERPSGSPETRTVEVSVADEEQITHIGTQDVPEDDLAKARRIVAGGYGLGNPDGFEVITDLADAAGAAVGASRPPADDGWVPYDRQIGVTGKEIDVELYIPCAISGDSYHMRSVNAEQLVAINTDPDARIFGFADIGIVGDVYEYGPALAEALREATETDQQPAEGTAE